MKLLLTIACLSVLVLVIQAVSVPRCPTDGCWPCKEQQKPCQCGTYKDYCGCCDLCVKCPGEECNKLAAEPCASGYSCKNASGRSPYFDPDGTCVKVEETESQEPQ